MMTIYSINHMPLTFSAETESQIRNFYRDWLGLPKLHSHLSQVKQALVGCGVLPSDLRFYAKKPVDKPLEIFKPPIEQEYVA